MPYMREIGLWYPCNPDNINILGPIFQQDNVHLHVNYYLTLELLANKGIEVLEHLGNSLNMSAIKNGWILIRITITNMWNRPPRVESENIEYAEWQAIPQDIIREWIIELTEDKQQMLDNIGGNDFYR